MDSWTSLLPNLETLTIGLNTVFQDLEPGGPVTVLQRDINLYSGRRSPGEIVKIRLNDNSILQVFCKYGGHDWHSHSLWGVIYEAEIYRHVLSSVNTTTVKSYGAYTAYEPDKTWLILEYLEDCDQLKNSKQPGAMIETTRWLARFHNAAEELIKNEKIPFLKIYDKCFYQAWADRILKFATSQKHNIPWLYPLCQKWNDLVETLLLPPNTIIHGDFYGSNVLMRGNVPFVIDWESAAAAVGEIDLAFHTEGWPEEIVKLCEEEYQKLRWPEGPLEEFYKRLKTARLYQKLRWLGDNPAWTSKQGFEQLHTLAMELDML